MRTLLDLVLPRECGGCGAAGVSWCPACAQALATEPVPVRPRVPGVPPAWATGGYEGPRRRAVVQAKERGRRDLAAPLGLALAGAVARLRDWGELDPPELAPLVLVPAPTRAAAARRRGGDPVARAATACAAGLTAASRHERVQVWPGLRSARAVRDSVGLSSAERTANLAGGVVVRGVPPPGVLVLVDDVLTTGATAAESTRALAASGAVVTAVLVVAAVR